VPDLRWRAHLRNDALSRRRRRAVLAVHRQFQSDVAASECVASRGIVVAMTVFAENVIPFPSEPDEWQDVQVIVPQPMPRIAPGVYEAVSVGLKRFEAFKRPVLMIRFDVFEGDMTDGVRLARLPWHCAWKTRPAPTSKLGRLLCLVGMPPSRGRAVNLRGLAHKLFRVRVDDVKQDAQRRPLTPETTYSVVVDVVAKL
jgi:hypothetical protein